MKEKLSQNHIFGVTKPMLYVLVIGAVALLLLSLFHFVPALNGSNGARIMTASSLMKTIGISELSTAEMSYTGIADVYKDENSKDILCRVCYSAVVKAGIDMNKLGFEFDHEHKTVTAVLPEIEMNVTIVDDKSMTVLPANADVEPHVLLKYSKADALREAEESEELLSAARDNLKATIEGLLYPILKAQGYTLAWK